MSLLICLIGLTPFSADKVEIIKENGESIVKLVGNVVIEDESTKITCTEARINEAKDNVVLNNAVKMTDQNGEISADGATYFFNERKGYLYGNVMLVTQYDTISSDSLFYDGIDERVEMFSNVKINDPKNNLLAKSERGWYDLAHDQGHITDDPQMEIFRENKTPIKIYARVFQLNTTDNLLFGFDSVIAIIDSLTIQCDTFLYNLKNETGSLVRPIIYEKNNTLHGSNGQFTLKNKELDFFTVENGRARYYTDKGNENIVEGSNISIFFKESKASVIRVEGQPKGILNLKNEKAGEDADD